MKISSRFQDGVKVVAMDGQLDTNTVGEFREAFLAEMGTDDRVVLDCTGLQYLDSSGLAALLNLHKNLVARDARMVLCGLPEGILRVVRFTKLDKVFELSENLDQGIKTLASN